MSRFKGSGSCRHCHQQPQGARPVVGPPNSMQDSAATRSRRTASASPASKLGRSCAVLGCVALCRCMQSRSESGAGPSTSHHLWAPHSCCTAAHSLHSSYPKPSRRKTARDLDHCMHAWLGSRHAAVRRHGVSKAQVADMSATQKSDASWRQGVSGDAPESAAAFFLPG